MQTARSGPPVRTPDTRRAAAACLETLLTQRLAPGGRAVSPLGAMRAAADCLERDIATSERVWIVRADAREPSADTDAHRRISAWPLRFLDARKRFEKPMLYLLHARATDRLRLASAETVDRGIFVNDAETVASSWPKGVTPDVPTGWPRTPRARRTIRRRAMRRLRSCATRCARSMSPASLDSVTSRATTISSPRRNRCRPRRPATRSAAWCGPAGAQGPARLRRSGCAARAARSRKS